MADRWTSEQNLKFVELYKDQSNLWNSLDPNYKNRDLRRTSLEHIRLELGLIDTNEVTKKIKNLRSSYNKEVLKIERSKKSGSGTDEVYKPSIKWFDSMDYIMKIINLKEKQTTSNLHSSTSEYELSEESSQTNYEGVDTSSYFNTVEKQPMKPPKKPKSNMKLSSEPSEIQAAVNELKELKNTLTMSAPSPKASQDECDIIGRHVAMQLRQLQPIDIIDATDEIQAVLSSYRKEALKKLENRNVFICVDTPSSYSSDSASSPQPTVRLPQSSYYQFIEPSVSTLGTPIEHSMPPTTTSDIITTALSFSLIN